MPDATDFPKLIDLYRDPANRPELDVAREQLVRLSAEVDRLRALESAVKAVLAQEGDDHCWRDVYTEMARLVGVAWVPKVLTEEHFAANCRHFYRCLTAGEHYVTPPDPENEALRAENAELADRIERAWAEADRSKSDAGFFRSRWTDALAGWIASAPGNDVERARCQAEARVASAVRAFRQAGEGVGGA